MKDYTIEPDIKVISFVVLSNTKYRTVIKLLLELIII